MLGFHVSFIAFLTSGPRFKKCDKCDIFDLFLQFAAIFLFNLCQGIFTKVSNGAVRTIAHKDFSELFNKRNLQMVSFITLGFFHSSYCNVYNYSDSSKNITHVINFFFIRTEKGRRFC